MKISGKILLLAVTTLSLAACKGNKDKEHLHEVEDLPAQNPVTVNGMKQDTVMFPSGDGLMMSAVEYTIDSTSPVIVLCHQARFSNYEYAEIAPRLNSMGYNCIAIDQRCGGTMDGHENMTYKNAVDAKKGVEYLDAEQDIVAGVDYAYNKWHKPIILWGSSYSGGLVLKTAANSDKVQYALAFSPGEYYEGKLSVKESIKGLNKPTFITSTEKEAGAIEKMIADVQPGVITQYFPETKGTHGSKCLWSADPSHEYYWKAVTDWLRERK